LGATCVVVTHYAVIATMPDCVVHFGNGRVVRVGVNTTIKAATELRRSFAPLCEWTETVRIAVKIQGCAPQCVVKQNYICRPLDLLRMWNVKIGAWILEQAWIEFVPKKAG
jgi:hypothetical protein